MNEQDKTNKFEAIVLPHLDAAYNLARWLTRNEHNADDLVQTAFMRAFNFFDGFRGSDARAWLLTIVRNTYFTSLRDNRHERAAASFDEEELVQNANDGNERNTSSYDIGKNPESMLAARDTKRLVNQALASLPQQFREVIVLKEINELSYKEIADIADIPLGTVMSRLARGRELLREYLAKYAVGE